MPVHRQYFRILIIFLLELSILLPINSFAQERQLYFMLAYANADSADEYASYNSSTSYKKSSVNGFKLYIPYLAIGQFEIKVSYTDSIYENYTTVQIFHGKSSFSMKRLHFIIFLEGCSNSTLLRSPP